MTIRSWPGHAGGDVAGGPDHQLVAGQLGVQVADRAAQRLDDGADVVCSGHVGVPSGRGARAGADDEARRQEWHRGGALSGDGRGEDLDGASPDVREVLVDRRQRWGEERSLRDVVEADHGHVVRHLPTGLVQRAQHTERHLVVAREDRRHAAVGRDRAPHVVAGDGGPVTRQGLVGRQPRPGHRRPPARHTRPGLRPVGWSSDVHDAPVSQPDQVLDGCGRAGDLVDADAERRTGQVALDDDDGQLTGTRPGCVDRGIVPGNDHHTLHADPGQVVDRGGQLVAGHVGQVDRGHREAGRPGGRSDPVLRAARTEVRPGGGDDADHPRAPPDQCARRGVGAVAELVDGLLHLRAGGGADRAGGR